MLRASPLVLLVLLAGCATRGERPAANAATPPAAARKSDSVFVYSPPPTRRSSSRPAHVAPLPPPVPDPPRSAGTISPGAPSDAQVRKELQHALGLKNGATTASLENSAELTPDGYATTPPAAPDLVDAVIRAGNRVSHAPYVYGGGHGTFTDSAYDCSGSVSFALAAAGLLGRPLDSGSLARWGKPGPGKWITVFANGGHAFMYVAGLRFDTSGRTGPRGSR